MQPIITKAGLAAVFNASRTGIAAEITHVVLGDRGYTPTDDQIALGRLQAKHPITGGEKLSSTLLHLTALADGQTSFYVREIGFLLSDGTLFAVWSHATEVLAYKAAGIDLLLAYDMSLAALPANSVTINTTGTSLSLSLAAPLAAEAAALIAEQLRGLQRQDQIDAQADKQRVAGEQIANLMTRMRAAEQRQDTDRDGLVSAAIANAAAVISLQNQLIQHIHGA
ncbi:phage tail protein [Pseudomonas putida]